MENIRFYVRLENNQYVVCISDIYNDLSIESLEQLAFVIRKTLSKILKDRRKLNESSNNN